MFLCEGDKVRAVAQLDVPAHSFSGMNSVVPSSRRLKAVLMRRRCDTNKVNT